MASWPRLLSLSTHCHPPMPRTYAPNQRIVTFGGTWRAAIYDAIKQTRQLLSRDDPLEVLVSDTLSRTLLGALMFVQTMPS